MNKRILLPLCVVIGLLLVACGNTEVAVNTNSSASPAAKTAPASTPATTTATTTSAGDKIGIADCDDFIAKYEACVTDKVPEVARAQYKAGIEQWRTTWRQLAANPQTKATLAGVCKQASETARTSMKTYNCTW
jgi:hypothetical protein